MVARHLIAAASSSSSPSSLFVSFRFVPFSEATPHSQLIANGTYSFPRRAWRVSSSSSKPCAILRPLSILEHYSCSVASSFGWIVLVDSLLLVQRAGAARFAAPRPGSLSLGISFSAGSQPTCRPRSLPREVGIQAQGLRWSWLGNGCGGHSFLTGLPISSTPSLCRSKDG